MGDWRKWNRAVGETPTARWKWKLRLLFAACRLEHERIRHDHDSAALGLGELPAAHRAGDALLDGRVVHRRRLHHRGDDVAGARDGELHDDATVEVGVRGELLLVAELHLVDVAPDDAA